MRRTILPKNPTWSILLFLLVITSSAGSAMAQSSPAWTQVFSSSNAAGTPGTDYPPGLQYPTAVYDKDANRLIVYGGLADTVSADVWALDNADGIGGTVAWRKVTPPSSAPAPAGRFMHAAVYDPILKKMIVFGGEDSNGNCLNDVWVLNNANSDPSISPTWTQLTGITGSTPGERATFLSAYSTSKNKLIVSGGSDCTTFSYQDLYILSSANGSGGNPRWSNIAPSGTAPLGNLGELYGASIYDSTHDRLMFWGSTYPSNQFNILSNATTLNAAWTSLAIATVDQKGNPLPTPTTAATGPTAVYNETLNKAIFFGGGFYPSTINGGQGGPSAELWGLGNANGLTGTPTWVLVNDGTANSPPARFGHVAVYDDSDPNNDQMIIFGGTDGNTALNDVWVLSNATGFQWTPPAPSLGSITPSSVSVGTNVKVTLGGADFVAGHTGVTIAGTGVTITNVNVANPSALTATFAISPSASPAAVSGPRAVTVSTAYGTSNSVSFSIVITAFPTLSGILSGTASFVAAPGTATPVTLIGTNFVAGSTSVTPGNSDLTVDTIQVVDPTRITAVFHVAHGAAGIRSVKVSNGIGTSNTASFSVITTVPVLNWTNPQAGNSEAPVHVTLSGSNFIPGQTTVKLSCAGGTSVTATAVSVLSTSLLTATFTIGSATPDTCNVTVTTPNGTSTNHVPFTVNAAPTLNGLTPNSGNIITSPVTVTLTGAGFTPTATVIADTGITVGQFTYIDPTKITATFTIASTAAGQLNVHVHTSFGDSNKRPFSITSVSPTLSSITPGSGNALGSPITVTLTGTNFVCGSTTINIDADSSVAGFGSPTSCSTTKLQARLTIQSTTASTHKITVTTTPPGSTSLTTGSVPFSITSSVPTLSFITPNTSSGTKNVPITLMGTNFTSSGLKVGVSGSGITVDPTTIKFVSSTQITATLQISSSAATGSRTVTVTTSLGGPSNSVSFILRPSAPTLSSISPSTYSLTTNGVGSVSVTLTGSGFIAGQTFVSVGGTGIAVSGATVNSSTSITATFTISAKGTYNVAVTSPLFGRSNSVTFTVN